jgi:hypothetical protein
MFAGNDEGTGSDEENAKRRRPASFGLMRPWQRTAGALAPS